MRKFLLISIITLFSTSIIAQEVVFEEEVDDYSIVGEKGPNLKKFNHSYYQYGFVLGENSIGANIRYGSSFFTEFGFRHKHKFNNIFSAGYTIGSRFLFYSLKQESGKILPDTIINRKENLNFYSLGGDLYFRINFSKRRGNMVGLFMDIGARADLNYQMIHQTKNTVDGIKSKNKSHGYTFDNLYYYGPIVRIGYNQFAITANYRYSDLFKSDANLPELPRLMFGLELSSFN